MEILLPFLLVILASFFQGSFGLGMKYMEPLKWEVWWIVHVTIAMIIFPIAWAILAVPNLFQVIANAPSEALFLGMLFGFLWGVGGILFGKSVPYIGLSLTYGIVMGLAASVGSIIPLLQVENAFSNPATTYVIIAVIIMLVGVALTAKAGIERDKLTGDTNDPSNMSKGIFIAVSCGVLSALLNVGFANATPVALEAEKMGAITRNSSLAAWVVVLLGAFTMNRTSSSHRGRIIPVPPSLRSRSPLPCQLSRSCSCFAPTRAMHAGTRHALSGAESSTIAATSLARSGSHSECRHASDTCMRPPPPAIIADLTFHRPLFAPIPGQHVLP